MTATLANMSGVLKALTDPLGAVTTGAATRSGYTTTKDAGLYALIDDIVITLKKLKNTIKINELGIISQLAGDTNDVTITLGTGTTNSSTAAAQSTIGAHIATLALLENDADIQTLSNAFGDTDRGRSPTIANNPAVLIGSITTASKYSESCIFALLTEQRMLLKRLLAGSLNTGLGDAVIDRTAIILTASDD